MQWATLGRESFSARLQVVNNRPKVHDTEFITSDGNIDCDNSEVQAEKTRHVPIRDTDPTTQSTTCFVKNYTGPTAHDPCVGMTWFTVHLDFGFHPTTTTCAGEQPWELSAHPYQARSGDIIDLGGATHTVSQSAVTCTANNFENTSFTVSSDNILIPITPGEDVE
ncbi:hypothetical protein [Pseudofrankia sp. BMG5.36]|uniref:hypothetical protein n=1 Tax=Pseudofrankia sp. BMG5.36 TaxID=1834512 RepID=UPI001041FB68|nr:hypothetical protein [Pseudofrankia sp. BMG5.36]